MHSAHPCCWPCEGWRSSLVTIVLTTYMADTQAICLLCPQVALSLPQFPPDLTDEGNPASQGCGLTLPQLDPPECLPGLCSWGVEITESLLTARTSSSSSLGAIFLKEHRKGRFAAFGIKQRCRDKKARC